MLVAVNGMLVLTSYHRLKEDNHLWVLLRRRY